MSLFYLSEVVIIVPRFEKRVRAFAIDTSGMMLAIILTLFVSSLLRFIILSIVFLFIYIVPYFISSGQSFGKRIQGIKIVRMDDKNANVFIVISRQLFILLASVLSFGIYLIFGYFFITEKGVSRTIHDYIFKTKVIDLKVEPKGKNDILGKPESLKKRGL